MKAATRLFGEIEKENKRKKEKENYEKISKMV